MKLSIPPHRSQIWKDFCAVHAIDKYGVHLFETSNGIVQTKRYGVDQRLILKRSIEMESVVIDQVSLVLEDYIKSNGVYDGLIYMMYWKDNQIIIPLYIGKSEKIGRIGNLSANIANIEKNKQYFCRWGDNYAYHIGDLSASILSGHHPSKLVNKYRRWAEKLFLQFPCEEPVLRRQTFFWIKAWKKEDISIWKEYGATSLTFLEYLLIGVASDIFPDYLLNSDGVNRQRKDDQPI